MRVMVLCDSLQQFRTFLIAYPSFRECRPRYVSHLDDLYGLDTRDVLFVQTGTHQYMTTKEKILLAMRQRYVHGATGNTYIYLDQDAYHERTRRQTEP